MVVEGVGDHGCEYMTGGHRWSSVRSAELAAGMSGGDGVPARREHRAHQPGHGGLDLDAEDGNWLAAGSSPSTPNRPVRSSRRNCWPTGCRQGRFAKVMPRDYRRVLDAIALAKVKAARDEATGGGQAVADPRFHEGRTATAGAAARRHPGDPGLARGVRVVRGIETAHPGGSAAWTAASCSATTAARSGNLIPEWNDLDRRGDWQLRSSVCTRRTTSRIHRPAVPGAVRDSLRTGINQDPVTIKQVEVSIVDRAGPGVQGRSPRATVGQDRGRGGSPAGSAAAQQLARARPHTVAVYERRRPDRRSAALRIPEFKMEKSHLTRRLAQMEAEGVKFRTGIEIGDRSVG